MRVLFTTQPGSGHWRPLAPLANALTAAGHEVAFATTPAQCETLARFGFRCFPVGADDWRREAEAKETAEAPAQAAAVWVEFFAGSRATRTLPDLLAVCQAWRPNLLVRESTEFAGCVAAERLGIPHAAVQVGAWRPELHRLIAPALDRLRATVGLPPDSDQEMLHRSLLLSLTPPSFTEATKPLPPTVHPMRYEPFDRAPGDDEQGLGLEETLSGWPTVYATLGTAYNRTAGLARTILAALQTEPVNLVMTFGSGVDLAEFGEQPPYVHLAPYVPQSQIFLRCDLVVCHGGFGTMLTALSYGLPMVMIPIAADQPDNARHCAELGVARVVSPEEQTVEAIRVAARDVLANQRYRERAMRMRDEMRAMPDVRQVIPLLERMADCALDGW